MSRVVVNERILWWALERAGLTPTDIKNRLPGLQQWITGERQPALRQLDKLARITRTPLGFFFLDDPPKETLPVPYFRILAMSPQGGLAPIFSRLFA